MNNNVTNKPLFFLFTCVKDGQKYIKTLFDSLLKQTRINFIHYIYEDGSNKPLGNCINNYRTKASKLNDPYEVIYEYNPINIGLNKSTQHCISKCSCLFFIWIDCDNYVDIHFFEELEKLYNKNKDALLLRSVVHNASNKKDIFFNCGTLKEANNKHQLGLFIREKYYYSLFAVNYKKYISINQKNIMIDYRSYFNDDQILLICLVSGGKVALSKKAIGYFTVREGQESLQNKLSSKENREYQIKLCGLISDNYKKKIETIYVIKDLYAKLNELYKTEIKASNNVIKQIKKMSRKSGISLKNYYDYSIIKYRIRVVYWSIKNTWKKN